MSDAPAWIPFAFLGGIMLLGIGGAIVSDLVDRHRGRRRREMQVWLAARPVRAYRDEALNLVAEAYADTRITADEHTEYVALIEGAMANEQIADILKRIAVVEKPE